MLSKKNITFLFLVVTAALVGTFLFFYVPKNSACDTLRGPAAEVHSIVCGLPSQSLYQKMYLAQHQYFFPKDSCFVNIETGDVDCQSFFTTGYNQSATTTKLSAFTLSRSPMMTPPSSENAVATSTLSSFSFEYPARAYLSEFGAEGVVFKGNLNISIPTNREAVNVFIFTTFAPMGSINPSAKILDDYKTDYSVSATSTQQVLVNGVSKNIETHEIVRILSSESMYVGDIPMLRQRYGVGHWTLDNNGDRVFGDTDESEVHDELRYVFFDGKTFVIITGWHSDIYIDQIAHSVRLLK